MQQRSACGAPAAGIAVLLQCMHRTAWQHCQSMCREALPISRGSHNIGARAKGHCSDLVLVALKVAQLGPGLCVPHFCGLVKGACTGSSSCI